MLLLLLGLEEAREACKQRNEEVTRRREETNERCDRKPAPYRHVRVCIHTQVFYRRYSQWTRVSEFRAHIKNLVDMLAMWQISNAG